MLLVKITRWKRQNIHSQTRYFFILVTKNNNIRIKLPYGGYLQVIYFINLKIYITGLSRHYFNRIMFLLRNRQKPVYNRFFVAERFHLQQAKPPYDQIVLVTFLRLLQPVGDQSATPFWHPPPPATSVTPPEIMVTRRSPTGCKLCVTGTLAEQMMTPSTNAYARHSYHCVTGKWLIKASISHIEAETKCPPLRRRHILYICIFLNENI